MYRYWVFDRIIPEDICDKIIEHGNSLVDEKAYTNDKDTRTRDTNVSWIDDTWIRSIITYHTNMANSQAGWDYDIQNFSEQLQFTKYMPGQHYNWHADEVEGNLQEPRKLSTILLLSNDDEYEGGEFDFFTKVKDGEIRTTTIDELKHKGSILVFPSTIYHRVRPVTSGQRLSLVAWTHGPKWR